MGHCSAESEDLILASSERESKRCGKSRLTRTAVACWSATSPEPHDTPTSANAAGREGIASTNANMRTNSRPLTSSAEDSPARISATPESGRELTANAAASGENTRGLLASYDRASRSWKTSQLCFTGEWAEFSETWPRSGMTRSGQAFELRTLARRTSANASGLLPTPLSSDGTKDSPNRRDSSGRRGWATPTASDGKRVPDWNRPNRMGGGRDLVTDVALRTPTSRDWKGPSAKSWRERTHGDSTPTLPDQIGGQLNPMWVEWLMGYPLGWTDLKASATQSCRRSRNGSGGRS